jgi:hypothetical protein
MSSRLWWSSSIWSVYAPRNAAKITLDDLKHGRLANSYRAALVRDSHPYKTWTKLNWETGNNMQFWSTPIDRMRVSLWIFEEYVRLRKEFEWSAMTHGPFPWWIYLRQTESVVNLTSILALYWSLHHEVCNSGSQMPVFLPSTWSGRSA